MKQADFDQTVCSAWHHFCPAVLVSSELMNTEQYWSGMTWFMSVSLMGSTQGVDTSEQPSILLVASERAAGQLASAMFDVAQDIATTDQRADALGEMANIIAGHVKTALDLSGSIMSPCWHEARDVQAQWRLWAGLTSTLGCGLLLGDDPVYVMLRSPQDEADARAGEMK